METRTFLICIHYNNLKIKKSVNKFSKKIGLSESDIIIVDTSESLKLQSGVIDGRDVNRFFEFSGYQYGLLKLKEMYERTEFEDEIINVIFINDTIFSSHITELFIRVCSKAISTYSHNRVTGLTLHKWHGAIIPTCCFVLSSTTKAILSTKLLPEDFFKSDKLVDLKDKDIESLYVDNRHRFTNAVKSWLLPKSFFSGWYKASPWNPIPVADYRRKYLAIFLEHSMVRVLSIQGYSLAESNTDPVIKVMSFFDRVNNNLLKLRYRTLSFFKYKMNSNE
ncbi:hypothetical protein CWB72_05565 [Pseudoalteromonas phenolica]|uniref:hypothetical protein n=1 Tax=Pseudoalteromonas phenolica TaxID=161398 RepID=UPI00110A31BD|nr:hypothetical protein [Pseudoalteromonas phenolica]TMN92352.1 hypothetical protein CWB72_05565 [Pseudoalteromonas phenolica]